MAVTKFTCPPQNASGEGSFSNNLVGLQLVNGGGFTQGNFDFTTSISEKTNRTFTIGTFSDPISLESMNISDIEQSKIIVAKNFQVYPNYDLSEITNFTLYGSLSKRLSTSVSKIINYFPAGLEVINIKPNFSETKTAINISYDSVQDETYFEIYLDSIRNPFDIDYTINSTRNIQLKEIDVSYLRNFSTEYSKYSLFVNGGEYNINDMIPTQDTDDVLKLYISGNPFSGNSFSNDTLLIRPKDLYVNKVFNENFDQVENFLLNRQIVPIYTAYFNTTKENEDGSYYQTQETVTFPLDGSWNLNITGVAFSSYLNKLNNIAEQLDIYTTNLISRFLTTGAIKEFDTQDQKVEKVLQIYGRSFDETKKFITALGYMNSVNYRRFVTVPI